MKERQVGDKVWVIVDHEFDHIYKSISGEIIDVGFFETSIIEKVTHESKSGTHIQYTVMGTCGHDESVPAKMVFDSPEDIKKTVMEVLSKQYDIHIQHFKMSEGDV